MFFLSVLLPLLAGVAAATMDGSTGTGGDGSDDGAGGDGTPDTRDDTVTGGSGPDDTSDDTVGDIVRDIETVLGDLGLGVREPDEESIVSNPGEEIVGTDGDDTLIGTERDDTMSGAAGNDRLDGSFGNDLIEGGEGDDVLLGRYGVDVVSGNDGDDLIKGGKGDDFLFGEAGDDTLIGSPGDDVVVAGSGSDYVRGDQGDDVLVALDDLAEETASDVLHGGIGNDRLTGDDGDTLTGGDGVDKFKVVVGGAPVTITDFQLFHGEGAELRTELLTFLNAEGEIISPEEIQANGGRLADAEDGSGVEVYYDGMMVAFIEGYPADDFRADTNWLGNFSPELTGLLDGDDLLEGDASGAPTDDNLHGGLGDDTLIGGLGGDTLEGGQGDDVLNTRDSVAGGNGQDLAIGGFGDDHFIADAGDVIGGQEGRDAYDIYVPTEDGMAPVEIYGYEFSTENQEVEFLTLLGPDGTPLSAEDVAENLVIYQDEDGTDAILEYDGRMMAVMHGVDANVISDHTLWIGNFDPSPTTTAAPTSSNDATQMSMTLQSSSGTGMVVSQEMFGANTVFSVNTDMGVPLENYVEGARALDIQNFRFPAGQGDSLDGENEGIDWLNVIELEENGDGEMVLREEVRNALDAAIAAHDNGTDVKVTMVIATKLYSIEEYEDKYDDIARFAEIMVTDYADQIEAIEIGNEYWAIGETSYGTKADIAARALAEGMERAGVSEDDQPSIIVQMATPNEGSEYHTSVDDRPFGERRDDANQHIIDLLSEEAREAIDGVVEHYYYRRDYDEFTGDGNEQGFIPNDYAIWEADFDKELDLHVTEWNIRTTNLEQNGIRSAGILPEMMEYMVSWGTDAAHGWPVVHNTTSMLAGTRSDMPILNEDGWVVNSVRGATFDVMSSELVGMQLLETNFSNDDGRMEIQAYQEDGKVVVQVASRTGEAVDLDLDLSSLVSGYENAYGVKVGYDRSADSSDGVYRDNGEYVQADSTIIDGEPYYFNEYDVRATVTDVEVNSDDVTLSLNPYEMVQLVFEFGDTPPPPAEEGRVVEGTSGDDEIVTEGGNDSILGLAGNDNIIANGGFDTVRGGDGNDRMEGGKQDDFVYGDDGNDALYGHAGDDSLKGGEGNDSMSGNQGADTLLGNQGDDVLRGGDDNDSMNGGQGSDTLKGGSGRDTMTGYNGSDTFAFELEDMMDGDIITDFEPGKDLISLDYDDISSIDDLTISEVEQGIVIYVGDHGGMLLQGELSLAQVADPRNFLFA
ncbi:calcium-binding protein [uncultured Shimia sp.]|uniref:calcium-binding protein n=1 Tax=uncultured Shimia sp. TaxID=573152 RepID=UPI0026032F73|nr:calcium-binding protein [uncultured Shimia sp.]